MPSLHTLCPIYRLYLPTGIYCIDFIDNVFNWDTYIRFHIGCKGIYIIVYGNKSYIMLWKKFRCIDTYMKMVSSKSGQVFYDYRSYFSICNLCYHILKFRSVK